MGRADSLIFVNQIIGRILRRHSRIHKSDQIRKRVIAKQQVHLPFRPFRSDRWCKAGAPDPNSNSHCHRAQKTVPGFARARLRRSPSSCTPSFCAIPSTSSETLPSEGHTPLRPRSKHFFVQIESAQQLLARILGMPVPVLRQRQPRRRYRPDLRVANQRQNRVIEGRGRNLDQPFARRLGVRRQDARPATPAPARSPAAGLRASSSVPCGSAPQYLFPPENTRRTIQSATAPADR